jgi:hypothetical protein
METMHVFFSPSTSYRKSKRYKLYNALSLLSFLSTGGATWLWLAEHRRWPPLPLLAPHLLLYLASPTSLPSIVSGRFWPIASPYLPRPASGQRRWRPRPGTTTSRWTILICLVQPIGSVSFLNNLCGWMYEQSSILEALWHRQPIADS